MATISDTGSAQVAPGVERFFWETLTENDTAQYIEPGGTLPLAGALQVTGTFGGATLVLQGSNDATNWVTLKDVGGTSISTTSAAAFEFSTSMRFVRPSASGGTSQDLDVTIMMRG